MNDGVALTDPLALVAPSSLLLLVVIRSVGRLLGLALEEGIELLLLLLVIAMVASEELLGCGALALLGSSVLLRVVRVFIDELGLVYLPRRFGRIGDPLLALALAFALGAVVRVR